MTNDYAYVENLERLCELAGVVPSYRDFYGHDHSASQETKRLLLSAMGLLADDDEQIAQSIDRLDLVPWRKVLPPVLVRGQDDDSNVIIFALPAYDAHATLVWRLVCENGETHEGRWHIGSCPVVEGRDIDGTWRERRAGRMAEMNPLPLGYHDFSLRFENQEHPAAYTRLIVAPERCYVPPKLEDGRKIFGVAVQLYSLRDHNDVGLGHFGTLRKFVQGLADTGVNLIGLNPIHELSPVNPGACSPYSPSSRLTLNPMYLDITAIPDFAESEQAQALFYHPDALAARAAAREREIIDYTSIVTANRRLIEICYASFRAKHLDSHTERAQQFHAFLHEEGAVLTKLCTFNALAEKFAADGIYAWQEWPNEYQDATSSAVERFAQENIERLHLFAYMQCEIHRQLRLVQEACANMSIGIYCDLAVGVDGNSADTWARPALFAQRVGVGAPPDPLSLEGQGWGLMPFSPIALYEHAYAEFVSLLRTNMRHAGALRIDHAMALLRLYWIPDGLPASEGAYIRYRVDDLFRILALESHRSSCLIIGEDLGTLPEGFRERLGSANLLSYRLLRFEREHGGGFIEAERYPALALASVGTHDLPPLAGFWHGDDILAREECGWVHDRACEESERAYERERLLHFLVETGDLENDVAQQLLENPTDDHDLEALIASAYRFVGRTPSLVAMVQVEDILGIRTSVNIPGTTNEHPNWRRRLPLNVDEILQSDRTQRLLKIMSTVRPGS